LHSVSKMYISHIHTKRTYFRPLMRDGTCSMIMVISRYVFNVINSSSTPKQNINVVFSLAKDLMSASRN